MTKRNKNFILLISLVDKINIGMEIAYFMQLSREQELIIGLTKNNDESNFIQSIMPHEIDWDSVFDISKRHKIFPFVYKNINHLLPDNKKEMFKLRNQELLAKKKLLVSDLEKIYHISKEQNLQIVTIKGPALSAILYDDPFLRNFGDIDILIKEVDFLKLDTILKSIGYCPKVHGETLKIISEPLFFAPDSHDVQYINSVNKTIFELKRFTWGISGDYILDFFDNTQIIKINNTEVETLNIAYTFLVLCSYTYNYTEDPYGVVAKNNLSDYLDLYRFITRYGKDVNWVEISIIANKYEILHKLYCVLNYLNDFYGDVIPNEKILLFNPSHANYEFDSYQNGTYFNWKSNIVTRIFNDEKRLEEFNIAFKELYFSKRNWNYQKAHKVSNDSRVRLNEIILNQLFIDQKYQFENKYMFTYHNKNLNFFINLHDKFREGLGNRYLPVLILYGFNYLGELIERFLSININGNKVVCVPSNLIERESRRKLEIDDNESIEIIDEHNMIKITLPIRLLEFDLSQSDFKLCYNIILYENLLEDLWGVIARKYLNDLQPGVIALQSYPEIQ